MDEKYFTKATTNDNPEKSSILFYSLYLLATLGNAYPSPTDNTVQDEPTGLIPTTRGLPMPEKSEVDTERRAEQEYLIFATLTRGPQAYEGWSSDLTLLTCRYENA